MSCRDESSDSLEIHLHFHGSEAQRRRLAVHLHFHDDKPKPARMRPAMLSHTVSTPVSSEPNPAKNVGSAHVICVQGDMNSQGFCGGRVYAAVYRSCGEIPSSPPSGAAFGAVPLNATRYTINEVGNVEVGSSGTNCLGLWPVTASGELGDVKQIPFTAFDAGQTACESMSLACTAESAADMSKAAQIYLARSAGIDDFAFDMLVEPAELVRVSCDPATGYSWQSRGALKLSLQVFPGPGGWEGELTLSGLGGREFETPFYWRACPFRPLQQNMFYLVDRGDSPEAPGVLLVESR